MKLPKFDLVRFDKSCEVKGCILHATIRRNPSGKYFVSNFVETEVQEMPKTNVGLKDFAIQESPHMTLIHL